MHRLRLKLFGVSPRLLCSILSESYDLRRRTNAPSVTPAHWLCQGCDSGHLNIRPYLSHMAVYLDGHWVILLWSIENKSARVTLVTTKSGQKLVKLGNFNSDFAQKQHFLCKKIAFGPTFAPTNVGGQRTLGRGQRFFENRRPTIIVGQDFWPGQRRANERSLAPLIWSLLLFQIWGRSSQT